MINVDSVITISLKDNHIRQTSAQVELKKLGLTTEFLLAERDNGREERGCFNSHLAAAKEALAAGAKHVLICEDDVKILPFTTKQITQLNSFINQSSPSYDLIYLGLIIGSMWYCGINSIVRARGAGGHAYILSRQGMEKIVAYTYTGVPIDKIFKRDFKCYSIYPIIAEQYPDEIMSSALTADRQDTEVKNTLFWLANYRKQKYILWKNVFKTLFNNK